MRTAKGRATRERIVAAAAQQIGARGIAETSLDDVIERAAVSKGQLYHYFADKADLLHAVIAYQADAVMAAQEPYLDALDSWASIRTWFDRLVALQLERRAHGGCPIGSLVPQLAETDTRARKELAAAFDRWESHLRDGLRTMRKRGKLRAGSNVDRLATATLASIQGGLLLSQARRDSGQLASALDAAYTNLRSNAAGTRR